MNISKSRIFAAVTSVVVLTASLMGQTAAQPATKPAAQASKSAAVATSYKRIPKRPLPPFKPQQPIRVQLDNGMVIFLQEDHELPFIDGTMRIRGGSRESSAEKAGMLGIYAQTWRTGGIKSKTGDELDEFLESRSAGVEAGASIDSTSLSFSSLKKDFDEVFSVFLSVLREPEFRQDKIDLAVRNGRTVIS
ncbi:MAG: insulinase family protein, partial [Terriglobales bacterium]